MAPERPPAFLVDEHGERFPIGERLVVGRSAGLGPADQALTLRSGRLARQHARFTRLPSGKVEVEDLGSPNGTFVNGVRLKGRVTLAHGDVVLLADTRFDFHIGTPALKAEALRSEVARNVDDEASWAVWADALAEAGHPLAERIRASPTAPEVFGGEVAGGAITGRLRLEWRHGFLSKLTVRERQPATGTAMPFGLLGHEFCGLLRDLEVPWFNRWADGFDTALPALRTLTVGPLFSEEDVARVSVALRGAEFSGAPYLTTKQIAWARRCWLEVEGGARLELTPPDVIQLPGLAVQWVPAVRDCGWVLDFPPTVEPWLNGRRASTGRLLPDDVCTLGDLRFVFRAEVVLRGC